MFDAVALTANDLKVEASDAPEALATLLKRYPNIATTDYSGETDAFCVLLRAWMAAHPDEMLELHLSADLSPGCTFMRADLPTDCFTDMLVSIIRRSSGTQYAGIGLNYEATELLAPVTTKLKHCLTAADQHIAVMLTSRSLYIGGHVIWQQS